MYDATNDSIASASCSGVPGIFMSPKSHAASRTSTPRVNGYVCPDCGQVKTEFDHEPRRHLVYVPARLFILEEQLVQYVCRPCGHGIVMAEGTPKLIPGSPVSSSVLAHLTVSRVVDAMPIERTAKQWARHGAEIATQRLYDWNARATDEVAFTHKIAHRELLTCSLASFDDTPLLAKVAGHANGTQRGRLWLYLGDVDRVAYCEYTEDWKGCHPQKVLAGFKGHVQSDGYGGIAGLFRGHDPPTKVGCNDHGRRKFVEALKLGDKRATPVVALYGELYAVEADAKGLSHDERLVVRQARSVPLWAKLSGEVARLEQLGEQRPGEQEKADRGDDAELLAERRRVAGDREKQAENRGQRERLDHARAELFRRSAVPAHDDASGG